MFKWSYLFFYFFIFNPTFLFPGLLPDNMIYTGQNRYCYVKNLELGDLVVSSKSYQSKYIHNNISGIKLYKQATNSAILITLEELYLQSMNN